MKPMLLLFILTALRLNLAAQTTDAATHTPWKITIRDYSPKTGFSTKSDTTIFVPYPQVLAQQPRKPGVYKLPQDGMPCLVPNIQNIVQMPNAMPQPPVVQGGKIPNPAERLRLKGLMNNFKATPSR